MFCWHLNYIEVPHEREGTLLVGCSSVVDISLKIRNYLMIFGPLMNEIVTVLRNFEGGL